MHPNAITPSIIIKGVGEKIVRFFEASAESVCGLMSSGKRKCHDTARTVSAKQSTPIKLGTMPMLPATRSALKRPPQKPARLHSPWNDAIIGRP